MGNRRHPFRRFPVTVISALILLAATALPAAAAPDGSGLPFPAKAATDSARSSVRLPECRFRPVQAVVPAGLIAAGSIMAATGWLSHDAGPNPSRPVPETVDNILEFTPMAAGMVIGLTGVRSPYTIRERLASRITAMAILELLVQPAKHLVDSRRPDHSDNHSFPSGHSAVAFAGAELMRLHYGFVPALGGYAAAIACATLRCVNHYHNPSDVIAGAGFGILSANAAMWLLPLECRLMPFLSKGRKSLRDVALLPGYYPEVRGFGLVLSANF